MLIKTTGSGDIADGESLNRIRPPSRTKPRRKVYNESVSGFGAAETNRRKSIIVNKPKKVDSPAFSDQRAEDIGRDKSKALLPGTRTKGRRRIGDSKSKGLTAASAGQGEGEHRARQTIQSDTSGSLSLLRSLSRQRRLLVDMRTALNNSVGGYLRALHGFRWDLKPAERTRICREVADMLSGKRAMTEDTAVLVATVRSGVAPIEARIKVLEKSIAPLVHELPVWPWIKGVRGIAEVSFATLLSETGDLSRFKCPYGVFLWLGMGTKTENRQDWYRPHARAAAWCIGDGLIKAGSRYRQVYDARREATKDKLETKSTVSKKTGETVVKEGQKWSKLHSHRDAHRIMVKQFLTELWCVWNGKEIRNAVKESKQ